jgi:hypothetical protein
MDADHNEVSGAENALPKITSTMTRTASSSRTQPIPEGAMPFSVEGALSILAGTNLTATNVTTAGNTTDTTNDLGAGLYVAGFLTLATHIDSTGGDTRCFIATASFGSWQEKHVRLLRQFRDQYLLATVLRDGLSLTGTTG